jgi:glutathione S-transferase
MQRRMGGAATAMRSKETAMGESSFTPILYLKDECPFCLKVRLFLLEAGLLGRFDIREFVPGDDREQAIRAELAPHFEKVTFPTLQVAPGEYINESDAIVDRYAREAGVDPKELTAYRWYTDGVMQRMRSLFQENMELKKQLEPA